MSCYLIIIQVQTQEWRVTEKESHYLAGAHLPVESSTARLCPFQRRCFSGSRRLNGAKHTQCELSIYLKHCTSSTAGGNNGLFSSNLEFNVTFSNESLENGCSDTSETWPGKKNIKRDIWWVYEIFLAK